MLLHYAQNSRAVRVAWLLEELNIEYDIKKIGNKYHFLQTHSTNPFLSETTIKAAIKKYEENYFFNYNSYFNFFDFDN